MRFLLASALFVSVLALGGLAHAAALSPDEPGGLRSAIERCVEEPMSLAIAIAEYEASRALTARSLTSTDEPVLPLVGESAPARPSVPRACRAPGDPGCHVSAPPATPTRVHLEQTGDGFLFASWALPLPPAPLAATLSYPRPEVDGCARDGHRAPPWRPPLA
jgi:hypothetical protein